MSLRVSAAASFACLAIAHPCAASPVTAPASKLLSVVVVSRHGVRSPTEPAELAAYVGKPWPAWEVAPGYLTPRGATLMTAFGSAYRAEYAAGGLFAAAGCPAPGSVYVWADVDERTRATARALLDGFAPHCDLAAHDLGATADPLFHALPAAGTADGVLAAAALAGSIGDDPGAIVTAYGSELTRLDAFLGCGAGCTPLASVPVTIAVSPKTGSATLTGAIDLASTAVEDLILAYADGKTMTQFGVTDLDAGSLGALARLHTAKSELATRTPYAARVAGSNLLAHLAATIDELAGSTPHGGTRVPAGTRFAAFVGHDTNLDLLGGLLRLRWLLPGYQFDETPPGGALVFEIYASGDARFVRTFFTAQSLDQMRTLSSARPARVPVFVPGCAALDCPLGDFDRIVANAVDPAFVVPW